ncbi:MAG TPA: TadE/TadG family type IV pilus assembly protein [Alphaproteobacteria bacterium]|nr:TadE/TadG family type IV pilus assembly protein [Alphaproteobacteria bacterium]
MSLTRNIARLRLFGRSLRRFLRSQRGVAAVEFALTLPIWTTLLLGTTDGAYCMLINERIDRIAYSVTDIVTQQETVTDAGLNTILDAAAQIMQPFPFGADGVVIVTSIYKPAGLPPVIEWQYSGGGSLARPSKIGSPGQTAALPNGLVLNDNDNIIISEVYYTYSPLFIKEGIFSPGDIYRVAIYKPRLSQLITPPT